MHGSNLFYISISTPEFTIFLAFLCHSTLIFTFGCYLSSTSYFSENTYINLVLFHLQCYFLTSYIPWSYVPTGKSTYVSPFPVSCPSSCLSHWIIYVSVIRSCFPRSLSTSFFYKQQVVVFGVVYNVKDPNELPMDIIKKLYSAQLTVPNILEDKQSYVCICVWN